jgi:hypothetical protein
MMSVGRKLARFAKGAFCTEKLLGRHLHARRVTRVMRARGWRERAEVAGAWHAKVAV